MKPLTHGVLLLAALVFSITSHAECSLQRLEPKGSEIHSGEWAINLGEADNPVQPSAWQGPLVAGSCKLDLGIIEQPLALAAGHYLYVPTYSGSLRKLTVVNLKDCSIPWKSTVFSGHLAIRSQSLSLGGKRIEIEETCLPTAKTQR